MTNEIQPGLTGISLNKVGKKFRDKWIFRNIELDIKAGEKVAITGNNGSGKSTLLQLISGYSIPSEGTIGWLNGQKSIPVEQIYTMLSFASPYMELIEEFTLEENVDFYCKQKKMMPGLTTASIIEFALLKDAQSRQVRNFSSGMKQRIKLALAFLADTPLLLLDEPLSNLDAQGFEWYANMVSGLQKDRTVLICSNQVHEETWFCMRTINVENYKLDNKGY